MYPKPRVCMHAAAADWLGLGSRTYSRKTAANNRTQSCTHSRRVRSKTTRHGRTLPVRVLRVVLICVCHGGGAFHLELRGPEPRRTKLKTTQHNIQKKPPSSSAHCVDTHNKRSRSVDRDQHTRTHANNSRHSLGHARSLARYLRALASSRHRAARAQRRNAVATATSLR